MADVTATQIAEGDARQGGTDIKTKYNAIRINNPAYLKKYRAGEVIERPDFYGFSPRQNCSWLAPYVVDLQGRLHQLSAKVYADTFMMAVYAVDADTYKLYNELEGKIMAGEISTAEDLREYKTLQLERGLLSALSMSFADIIPSLNLSSREKRREQVAQVLKYTIMQDLRYMTAGRIEFFNELSAREETLLRYYGTGKANIVGSSESSEVLKAFAATSAVTPLVVAIDEKGTYTLPIHSLPKKLNDDLRTYETPMAGKILINKDATKIPKIYNTFFWDFLKNDLSGYDVFFGAEQVVDAKPTYTAEDGWTLPKGLRKDLALKASNYKFIRITPPQDAVDMQHRQQALNNGVAVPLFIASQNEVAQTQTEDSMFFTGRFMYSKDRHLFAECEIIKTTTANPFTIREEDLDLRIQSFYTPAGARNDYGTSAEQPQASTTDTTARRRSRVSGTYTGTQPNLGKNSKLSPTQSDHYVRQPWIEQLYIPDGQIPDKVWLRCSTNMGCFGFYDQIKKQSYIVPCDHRHKNWIIDKIVLVEGEGDDLDYLTNVLPAKQATKKKGALPWLLLGTALLGAD